METQHVPAYIAKDAKGDTYARVAPTRFPAKPDGDAPLIHRITAYSKAALWDGVEAWFDGGQAASGAIDPKAAARPHLQGQGRGDLADLPAQHRAGQEGARRLELVRHARRPGRHHLRLQVGEGRGDDRRRTARSSPCPSTTAWRRTRRTRSGGWW